MKKYLLAAAAVVALAMPAAAADFGFGAGGFAGGLTGAGQSNSGSTTWGGGMQYGGAQAFGGTKSYGQAESGFSVGVGSVAGAPTMSSGAFGMVASGSSSNSTTNTAGNGFGAHSTGGSGFGNTQFGGIGGAIGGFVTAP